MKTMIFKNRICTAMFAVFSLLSLPSCEWGNEETPELSFEASLVGTWDITSYTLDGDEWMGLIVEAAYITFQEPVSHSGIFEQVVTFTDEEPVTLSGRYIVDEEHGQVVLYYEGEPIVADIVITGGNKMRWESIQDQYPLVLKATKRL